MGKVTIEQPTREITVKSNPDQAAANLERYLTETLRGLTRTRIETLLQRRYERLRNLGKYFDSSANQSATRRKTPATRNGRPAASKAKKTNGVPIVDGKKRSSARRAVQPARGARK